MYGHTNQLYRVFRQLFTVHLPAEHFVCDILNKIRGSHGSFADNSGLLGCDVLSLVPNASIVHLSPGVLHSYIG